MESSSLLQIASTVYEKDISLRCDLWLFLRCVLWNTNLKSASWPNRNRTRNLSKCKQNSSCSMYLENAGISHTGTQSCHLHSLKEIINSFLQHRKTTTNASKGRRARRRWHTLGSRSIHLHLLLHLVRMTMEEDGRGRKRMPSWQPLQTGLKWCRREEKDE